MKPLNLSSPQLNTPQANSGIQVIARAAAILRELQANPNGLSLGEIANAVDLPRSTVQRIVSALANERLTMSASPTSGVRLGPALLGLAAATRFPIAELARPTLEALAQDTGESAVLTIFDQNAVSVIDQISASHRLASVLEVGISLPWHCSASGKAMLASLDPAQLRTLQRQKNLQSYTENTLTTWEALLTEMESIRSAGVAFDREEHTLGVVSSAVSLRPLDGMIAAIAITAPRQRFIESERELVASLLEHAGVLQRRLTATP